MDRLDISELDRLLVAHSEAFSPEQRKRILAFYELLVEENATQNLTRLVSPADFMDGHLEDVRALLKSGLVKYPAMDLGSGGGVPGLLAACISDDQWILCESEGRKADFLSRAVVSLGLGHVKVVSGRAETWLKSNKVESIVARAVGPVDRIFAWVRECSTWNSLVLLKGPGWEREWAEFGQGRGRGRLQQEREYRYTVGPEGKSRVIVRLTRVPRGTVKAKG